HQRLDENHGLAGQEVKVGCFCGRGTARKSTLFKPRVSELFSREYQGRGGRDENETVQKNLESLS
ncbi:MAG: hypothetical protein JXA21_29475, partial [Anaerolineae bacterium]|nr:hypothetical protein [Anaerolineae bacterium]